MSYEYETLTLKSAALVTIPSTSTVATTAGRGPPGVTPPARQARCVRVQSILPRVVGTVSATEGARMPYARYERFRDSRRLFVRVQRYVAASYLLMAILAMLAGGTGDAVGHKRMLLFGLGAVVVGELTSMFWLGTPGFKYADVLLNLAQIAVTPMCIAIVSFAFVPGVRPFAYGVLFSTQAIAIGLSSALYSVLKPLGNGTIVFLIPVVLGVVGLRLIQHAVHETDRDKPVEWRELLINVAKHSGAGSATVESTCRDGQLVVCVSDNGKGYDVLALKSAAHRGLGLISVRERMALIGGTLDVTTSIGGGTRSVLSVPLAPGPATPPANVPRT